MSIEIERKFLVNESILALAIEQGDPDDWDKVEDIQQGYIIENEETDTLLRVRIATRPNKHEIHMHLVNEREAWITIKKAISDASRYEFEYEIPVEDAEQMLEMCPVIIRKTRQYFIEEGVENYWVIDTFHMPNGSNLVIAETELSSEDQEFDRPERVGMEVTDDSAYYNSNIAKMMRSM